MGDPEVEALQNLYQTQKDFAWTAQGLHTAVAAVAPFAGSLNLHAVPVAELWQACAFLDRGLMIQAPARDSYSRMPSESLCARLSDLQNGLSPGFVIIAVAMAADAHRLA